MVYLIVCSAFSLNLPPKEICTSPFNALNDFSNFVCAVYFLSLIMECFHPAEISMLKIPKSGRITVVSGVCSIREFR